MVRARAGRTRVAYDPATARVTVGQGDEQLLAGRLAVTVDGERFPQDDAATVAEFDDRVRVGHEGPVAVAVDLRPVDRAVDVTVTIRNEGETAVSVGDVRPLVATDPGAFDGDTRIFEHGYQSWTPTGTLPADRSFPDEDPTQAPQMVDPEGRGFPGHDGRTSNYLTALATPETDLTLGFLDHSQYLTRFDVRTNGSGLARVAAVSPVDGAELAPGRELTSAPLRIDADRSIPAALEGIAATTADRMEARIPRKAPTGWCSWYHYFRDVTADDVRENLRWLREWGLAVDVVQIDDGYQTAFGDWLDSAEGFADGETAALADEIDAAGYAPGLWVAPFFVQADADLVADHPEWVLTRDGERVDAGKRHGGMLALDPTHPGVQGWLEETFRTITGEWGFRYLKLDFLFAAALGGDYHTDAPRAAAYRAGLRTIREAVGDDVFLLGCGAPLGPSVGLVDAMRVGPDTAPYWRTDGAASQPAHENAVRNVLNRQFCHRRFWANDPDCQLVRETTDLTAPERRSFAAIVALSGGLNVFSDRIGEIDAAGRELLERTLPPVETGRVEGLGERELPNRLVSERPADDGLAVAAFNWDDEARTVTIDPTDYGFGVARAWDAFARAPVAAEGGADPDERTVRPPVCRPDDPPIQRDVPAHGCLLVHLAPARERPHLLGADHLAGGGSRVTRLEWRDGALGIDVDADESARFIVATPGEWTLAGAGPAAVQQVTVPPDGTTFRFVE